MSTIVTERFSALSSSESGHSRHVRLHVEFRTRAQNRTTRVPVAKRRFQEANSRDWLTIIVNCVLRRWPDTIHNRNDPS